MTGHAHRIWLLILALIALPLSSIQAEETNFWPFIVQQEDSAVGRFDQWNSLGPFFAGTERGSSRILSFRPFWTRFNHTDRGTRSQHFLYPFVNWTDYGDSQFGHVLNLVQYRRVEARDETFFQVFPFLFSRQTDDPDASYFALWPIGGVLKNRFWRDRITFAAWPLFVQTEREDETWTHTPYPFIQTLRGPHSSGFGLWPFYGHFERENDYAHTWALWPFIYHYRDNLDSAVPYVRFGVLPFYHRETGEGLRSESYIWPFFGYTREWEPRPEYRETRYFWPLLVQGRGEERTINRWMPVFTHETRPGYRKNWYLWPMLQREVFMQPGLRRERDSLFYFIYRDERQYFSGTRARLTFLWPLFAYWNDGYDRTQLRVLDPLTVFFPSNEQVRENWTPLFSLYTYDERDENTRHSLLWDLMVWEKDTGGTRYFAFGPLFEFDRGSHWSVLKGLVERRRTEGEARLSFFWRD